MQAFARRWRVVFAGELGSECGAEAVEVCRLFRKGVLLEGEALVVALVEARFEDVVVVAFEVVGGAGKDDVGAVGGADVELRRVAAERDDAVRRCPGGEVAGFGGDVFRAVAKEVGVGEVVP